MITLRSSFLAATGLVLSLAMGAPASQAGPALSYYSDEAEYDQDSCVQRAQGALAGESWQGIHPNGHSVVADRGNLSALIVCLSESLTQSIPVIVVTGGGNSNDAATEVARLKYQLLDQ